MVELKSFLVMNGTKEEALGFIPSTTNQRRFRVALMLHEPPPSRKLFRRRQTTVFWGVVRWEEKSHLWEMVGFCVFLF